MLAIEETLETLPSYRVVDARQWIIRPATHVAPVYWLTLIYTAQSSVLIALSRQPWTARREMWTEASLYQIHLCGRVVNVTRSVSIAYSVRDHKFKSRVAPIIGIPHPTIVSQYDL